METRALAIAFFYAVGTAVGGITDPLLFGHLISSGQRSQVAIGFFVGAAVMAIGAVAGLLFGIKAEQSKLEDIAQPLTVEDAEEEQAQAGVANARAELHRARAADYEAAAAAAASRAGEDRRRHEQRARELDEHAQAAEERLRAAEHRAAVESPAGQAEDAERAQAAREQARERDRRLRTRIERRQQREGTGLRRLRPGPGARVHAPGLGGMVPVAADAEEVLDHEIEAIGHALDEHGALERRDLARLVGARYWGPGRFRRALGETVDEGRARRASSSSYAPPNARMAKAPDPESRRGLPGADADRPRGGAPDGAPRRRVLRHRGNAGGRRGRRGAVARALRAGPGGRPPRGAVGGAPDG